MDFIQLLGADDVSRAGYAMKSAADTMQMAASSISESIERNRSILDDFLLRLEEILERKETGK